MRKQRHKLHRRTPLIIALYCCLVVWNGCVGTTPTLSSQNNSFSQVFAAPDTLLASSESTSIAEWTFGSNFIPLRTGFAAMSTLQSLLFIYNDNAELQQAFFIGRDTILSPQDPYLKTLGMQAYHYPDAMVWMGKQGASPECIGLLSGQRLYLITTDGKCLSRLGLDTEWPDLDLAFNTKNESRLAYWPSSNQLSVTITPSDYFNQGDRPTHFTQDSLFLIYQLPSLQSNTFTKITPLRLSGQYGSAYSPDKPIPHLDRMDWYSNTSTNCLSAAASPIVKVYNHPTAPLTSFGQAGKQIQDIPFTQLNFDTLANKRYRRHQYDMARYTSPEYGYASYLPEIGLAFRAYREGTDTTTANRSLQDRWDHRPQWLQLYHLKTGQVRELPLPPHQRILYISSKTIYTVAKAGHLISYPLNRKAIRRIF